MTTTTMATSELVPGYRDVTSLTVASFLARFPSRPLMSQEPAVRLVISQVTHSGGRLLMASQPRVGPGRQSGGSSNTRAISRVVLAW